MARTKARTDKNQSTIVKELRKSGASVFCSHQMGKGFPDIVVGWRGFTFLFEIKSEKGKLTTDQQKFIDSWLGQVDVITSVEEALSLMAWSIYQRSELGGDPCGTG